MSDSVFADNINATLVFKVASANYYEDPDTGNLHPVSSAISVKAMLRRPRNSTDQIEFAGADRTHALLRGRAVEPMFLPQFIGVGARAKCTIVDALTGYEQQGDFEITEVIQSAFTEVSEVLGHRFQGVFKVDNTGELLYA